MAIGPEMADFAVIEVADGRETTLVGELARVTLAIVGTILLAIDGVTEEDFGRDGACRLLLHLPGHAKPRL